MKQEREEATMKIGKILERFNSVTRNFYCDKRKVVGSCKVESSAHTNDDDE